MKLPIWGVVCLIVCLAGLSSAQEPAAPVPPSAAPGSAPSAPAPRPVKGYVLQVAGKLVYLDLGMRDNVRVGDTFEIIRDQEIVHPITGENLGGKAPVGVVRVTQVFEKLSIAEVVSVIPGASMMRMDRIRMGSESMEPPQPAPAKEDTAQATPPPPAPPPEHEMVHTPDGVVGGIDLGLRGGYETKQKSRAIGMDILLPLSRRFALGGEYLRSAESHEIPPDKESLTEEEMGGRLRVYMGRWLRSGEDINPDGDVGSVVLDLGAGVRRMKTTTEQPVIVSIDTTQTPPDTTRGTSEATARTRENRMNFGVALPLARKLTLGFGYDWEKHVSRVNAWFRYYLRPIDSDWEGANPDGKVGSPVFTVFGSYDTKGISSKKWMGIDVKFPLSRMFTFGLAFDTNQKLQRVRGGLNIHVEKRLLR